MNTRTPAIEGSEVVRLKSREHDVLHWDVKLTLEFNGKRPAVCAIEITPLPKAVTVYLLGDSTVTDAPFDPGKPMRPEDFHVPASPSFDLTKPDGS